MLLMWRSESRHRQMHRTTYLVLQLLISTMLLVSSSYYNTSAFNDSLYSHVAVEKKPANKHLFMIGDSIMRYHYLTLVNSLKFEKTLVDNGGRGSFIQQEGGYNNWTLFFETTNKLLQPYEHCDCYRDNHFNPSRQFENRYYYDEKKKIRITFLTFLGRFVHGHWNKTSDNDLLRTTQGNYSEALWSYSLPAFIKHLVPSLLHKGEKSILVLNAGHHQNNFHEESYRDKVRDRALKTFDQFIWKTTTYPFAERREMQLDGQQFKPPDFNMCALEGITCLNMSWTKHIHNHNYTDFLHFKASTYNIMTMQMLDQFNVK